MDKQPEALRMADWIKKTEFVYSANPFINDCMDQVEVELRRLHQVNQELVEAFEKLARLGNGDQYGNSEGNMIAREILAKHKEQE